jgi:predicted Zn-dependent protease
MLETIEERFRDVAPPVDFWSLRVVEERSEELAVVRNVVEPPRTSEDRGVMVTVVHGGAVGYGATCDLTIGGLRRAAAQAAAWAERTAGLHLVDVSRVVRSRVQGVYESPRRVHPESLSLGERIDRLRNECRRLGIDGRLANWEARLWRSDVESLLSTSDGSRVSQRFHYVLPMMSATASEGGQSETRTFGGHAWCRQGGFEVLDEVGYFDAAPRIAAEALELLSAPNCPSQVMDCLLAPDQMILQVHESIGHPLELDRILGDERSYAGRSFVTADMFGRYRYGSDLLNVTFDPGRPGEFASYAFDDEGEPARPESLIRAGILLRPLGGMLSRSRAGTGGVACTRASGWNRPPIDRMANVNLEPGQASLDEMIATVDRGIYMETNSSWSIDDSRLKFQFGCERARLIRGGKLREVVRKPNYRGITPAFWLSLDGVGDADTLRVLGTPYCGKGEPNQAIRAGHAAPACLFRNVDVFGGMS